MMSREEHSKRYTLKEKLATFHPPIKSLSYNLIPISDASLYYELCNEGFQQVCNKTAGNIIIISDPETLVQIKNINDFVQNLSKIIVIGNDFTCPGVSIETYAPPHFFQSSDRLFILLSPSAVLSFFGTITTIMDDNNNSNFDGGWSYQWKDIQQLVKIFAPSHVSQDLLSHGNIEVITTITTKIVTYQLNILSGVHKPTLEIDKNELTTVLEILKVISSKKRAHDVLFVFVEQISRVVPSDRCSIVRVWGQEDVVHVLASHDDANLYDITVPLIKYPEIRKAISIGDKVVINNVENDPLIKPCLESLIKKGIRSILVIPIILYDPEVGSLLLRAIRREKEFTEQEINFFEIVTSAAANAIEKAHLFETVQEANKKLEQLAVTDDLTGIYNHRYFRERLEEEVFRSLRYNVPLSCVLFDIDDFKACNDSYGHLFGDAVLKDVASRIQQAVRRTDIVARYGGEEFIVIMPQTPLEGAYTQAERIRRIIADKPFVYMGKKTNITISGGVAEVVQNEVLSMEDLLRIADQCLYRAKREGKNRVVAPKYLNNNLNEVENK